MLASLNEEQHEAVVSPVTGCLQIIAGPGTGKTKVLTTRIAYALKEHKLLPQSIILTTFTKNAAHEMMERLQALLAEDSDTDVSKIHSGTFHSICYQLLRKYGSLIDLNRFEVANSNDSAMLIKNALKRFPSGAGEESENNTEKEFSKKISSLKTNEKVAKKDSRLFNVFNFYCSELRRQKLLDYDDLLIETKKLLQSNPELLKGIKHVFVDEFQDTSMIQLELLRLFSKDNLTVVGDPNQSIYGFRNALPKNFDTLEELYGTKNVRKVYLLENYRSTQSILDVCGKLIETNTKKLKSQYSDSVKPTILEQSAQFVAKEIEFLVSLPNLFEYKDIAILLRASHQSRELEKALLRNKIPYEINKGKAFWDSKEVLLMVDYLKVLNSNWTELPTLRILGTLPGIGTKTIEKIGSVFEKNNISPFNILERASINEKSFKLNLSKNCKESIQFFLNLIKQARKIMSDNSEDNSTEVLKSIITEKNQISDEDSRIIDLNIFFKEIHENVSEINWKSKILKAFDYIVVNLRILKEERVTEKIENILEIRKELSEFEVNDETMEVEHGGALINEALARFLESINLFLGINSTDSGNLHNGKVTISTIHGSKGLEWPIVYIYEVCEGILPNRRSFEDEKKLQEEARILYVAMTRARFLLTLTTCSKKDQVGGKRGSRFLKRIEDCTNDHQSLLSSSNSVKLMYKLQNQQCPSINRSVIENVIVGYSELLTKNENYHGSKMEHKNEQFFRATAAISNKNNNAMLNKGSKRKHEDYSEMGFTSAKLLLKTYRK